MYKLKKKNFSLYLDQLKERLFRERERERERERVFPENKEHVSAAKKQKKKEIRRQKTKKQLGAAVIEKKEVRTEETGKLIFEERNRGLNICINAQPLKIN